MDPRISICIPAYRRARFLPALLDSIRSQTAQPYEIVIREDNSSEREAIREIASDYSAALPIRYLENPSTFGYDRNVRSCLEAATGDFCLFMGNDDVLCPYAISQVKGVIRRVPDVGVITRAYGVFKDSPDNVVEHIRHFPSPRMFPAGRDAVIALYRRTGVLSGLVFRRDAAVSLSTDKWDGSLYYQLYLTANLLVNRPGAYIDTPLVLCRDGVPPDFGNSPVEQPFYTPGGYTTTARLKMFSAMVDIIRDLDDRTGAGVLTPVLRDLGAYSYYLLAGHSTRPLSTFLNYYRQLGNIGVNRHPLYHIYFASLLLLGPAGSLHVIESLRRLLGRSPNLSALPSGQPMPV